MAQSHQAAETQRRTREAGREQEQEQARNREQEARGGKERMEGQQQEGSRRGGSEQQQQQQQKIINMTAIAARGWGQLYDMQVAAGRMFLQTQARAAAAFGIPDYSDLFRVGDDRARRVFSSSTEHLLDASQRASQTIGEIQRHMGRVFECNAVNVSETWRNGLEEFANQAEEGLEQLQELARQQAEEAVRAAESFTEQARESMRQGGEEMRETMRQGMERGREVTAETGEAMREEGERATSQTRTRAA